MLRTMLQASAGWPVPLVLLVAAALLFAESGLVVGLALPGTTLLVALGLWAHVAPGALVPVIAVAAVATVAGAAHGWWRGRTRPGLQRPAALVARSEQAAGWFADRGPTARAALIGAGHWASAARPLMPRVAGRAGVPFRVAGPTLVVAGSAWAATTVLLGNLVGPHVVEAAGAAPIGLVVVLIAGLVWRGRARRRARPRTAATAFPRPDAQRERGSRPPPGGRSTGELGPHEFAAS